MQFLFSGISQYNIPLEISSIRAISCGKVWAILHHLVIHLYQLTKITLKNKSCSFIPGIIELFKMRGSRHMSLEIMIIYSMFEAQINCDFSSRRRLFANHYERQ